MTTTTPQPHTTATIEPSDLVRMRAEDPAVHVIDVRTPGEFETGHIDDVVSDLEPTGLTVIKSGRVQRKVTTAEGDHLAIDALVTARR